MNGGEPAAAGQESQHICMDCAAGLVFDDRSRTWQPTAPGARDHAHQAVMTVTVLDRGGPHQRSYVGVWSHTVTISGNCPRCGGPRGTPRCSFKMEDGESYRCDRWENPCGHTDWYEAVLVEAGVYQP